MSGLELVLCRDIMLQKVPVTKNCIATLLFAGFGGCGKSAVLSASSVAERSSASYKVSSVECTRPVQKKDE